MNDIFKKTLKLQFDFNGVSSTIIPDVSGNGQAGVIRNQDAGGAVIENCNIYGSPVSAILLPGGENGGYIQLPNGVLNNKDGITISFWCRILSCNESHTLVSFGSDFLLYVNIAPCPNNENSFVCFPCVTSGGRSQERTIPEPVILDFNRWYQIAVTLTPNQDSLLNFYVDGTLKGTLKQSRVTCLDLASADNCYIGTGFFGTLPVNAEFSNIQIYDAVLTAEEVRSLFYITDEQCILADKSFLDSFFPSIVYSDLELPASGPYGSYITYSSSNESFFYNNGKVIRPSDKEEDALITVTARLSFKQMEKFYRYKFTIPSLPNNRQIAEHDTSTLVLPKCNFIYSDIILPADGEWGSKITWTSSNTAVVNADGIVKRPPIGENMKDILLTAAISCKDVTLYKSFHVSVLPLYKKKSIKKLPLLHFEKEPGVLPTLPTEVYVEYEDGVKDFELILWEPVFTSQTMEGKDFKVKGVIKNYPNTHIEAEIIIKPSNTNPQFKASGFPLGDSKLMEDNIFTQNYQRDLYYLKLLDADRMLYNFRHTFGEDTKHAAPIGGWDEPLGLLRGHSTGHYLSALALAFGSTGDKELKEKIDYMVFELYKLQQLSKGNPQDFITRCTPEHAAQSQWSKDPSTWGEGFLSAYSPDQFALLEQYTPYATIWAPYYTLHKILAGLLDCYELAQNETALLCAQGIGNWVYARLSHCSKDQLKKMWSMYIAGEYGGMNEALARLYNITNNPLYLKAAKLFDNPRIFEGLEKNMDVITTLHANQHIPQILGALEEYKACYEKRYYDIAEHFWDIVTNHYTYSIGGVGRGENFKEPDVLANNIESDRNCETCATYNMLKLSKELYCYQPEEIKYMDYYEKALYNHIIASQNPEISEHMHHGVTYMLPIGPGEHKEYGTDYDEFTCCHGTGMENHVKYQESVYFVSKDNETLYVNLYMPSRLDWKARGITVSQTGRFPSEDVMINIKGKGHFTLKLRVPHWCKKGYSVTINGEAVPVNVSPSTYISLARNWQNNDTIHIHMPFTIHFDQTIDDLDLPVASIMYGPLVMVAKDNSKEWITLILTPNLEECFSISHCGDMPVLDYFGLEFVPMYAAYNINYHTYVKINFC